MELRWPHIIRLYHVFLENDEKENCAQLIEEKINKMISINDEHYCNVASINSMNIQNTNDDYTSHDKNVSYKHANFCGVERLYEDMPYRNNRFCKKQKHDETNFFAQSDRWICYKIMFSLSYYL